MTVKPLSLSVTLVGTTKAFLLSTAPAASTDQRLMALLVPSAMLLELTAKV